MQTEFLLSDDDFLALFAVEIDRTIDGACELLTALDAIDFSLAQGSINEDVPCQNIMGRIVPTDRSAFGLRSVA